MNRTKAFGLIAVLSTLLLTASIASAHGRGANQSVRKVKVVHAKAVPMAKAAPLHMATDPIPPITYPSESPSMEPCSQDDSYEGTDDSSESSDDDMMPPTSTPPPVPSGTCSYSDDDSSMGMDD